MGLGDLIEDAGGSVKEEKSSTRSSKKRDTGAKQKQPSDDKEETPRDTAERIRKERFLLEYDCEGEDSPDPDGKTQPDPDEHEGWVDVTESARVGTLGNTEHNVHGAECPCGKRVTFYMRRAWSRCRNCHRVLIITDYERDWWKEQEEEKEEEETSGGGLSEWM